MQVKHKLESKKKKKVVMIENEVVSKLRGVEMAEIERAIEGARDIEDTWLKGKISEIKGRRLKRFKEHSGKDEK
ncbi:MAG: hypothetical protein II740_10390 [Lachnospiraceae bacterium]|nr:hypothetical protein [Lachnospiraceae bacterium]